LAGGALQVPFDGTEASKHEAREIIALIDRELQRVNRQLRGIALFAGTPAYGDMLEFLSPLLRIPIGLRMWLESGRAAGSELLDAQAQLWNADTRGIESAMRDDLARPWLRQYHDNGNRRRWRFWERR
jgi:hypothetical protein